MSVFEKVVDRVTPLGFASILKVLPSALDRVIQLDSDSLERE